MTTPCRFGLDEVDLLVEINNQACDICGFPLVTMTLTVGLVIAKITMALEASMNLSAANYWRLAKVYPLERKPDEALYVTEQRRKERMRLHLAKERFGYLKAKPLRDAVIILRSERLSLRKIAHIWMWILRL